MAQDTDDLLLLIASQHDRSLIVPVDMKLSDDLIYVLDDACINDLIVGIAWVGLTGMSNRYVISEKGWERLSVLLKVTIQLDNGRTIEYKE